MCGCFNVTQLFLIFEVRVCLIVNTSLRGLENVLYYVLCDGSGYREGLTFRRNSVIAAATGEITSQNSDNAWRLRIQPNLWRQEAGVIFQHLFDIRRTLEESEINTIL